jgi:hypothetical protein
LIIITIYIRKQKTVTNKYVVFSMDFIKDNCDKKN